MSDRRRDGATRADAGGRGKAPRRALRPSLEGLEGRALMATLAPIADVNSPSGLGFQVPLQGGTGPAQTFTATSTNPNVRVSPAGGNFWTVGVQHDSSGPNDPAFVGSLTFQLFEELTPLTVSRIEELVRAGFYTSPTQPTTGSPLPTKNFHRIVPGFMAQGGSRTGEGTGSVGLPGFPFPDEFRQQLVFNGNGQLAMANAGDDTNDSQFFVTYGPQRNLDYNHTIFGQLVDGFETFARMERVALTNQPFGGEESRPVNPVLITSSTLTPASPDGVLHVDTTGASVGETSQVIVTAATADGTTTSRTFNVNVTPNVDAQGQPINQPPFLLPVQDQVVGTTTTAAGGVQGQTAIFRVSAANPEPGDTLTYVVNGGTQAGSFLPVQNATASVDANGIVTVTPNPGFTGVINLQVGVRDQVVRPGRAANLNDPANFDTQDLTLTVRQGALVNLQPIAVPGSAEVLADQANPVQLAGLTANPQSAQTLVYEILAGPTSGTLTDFNPATGTFSYTPRGEFVGTDSVRFRVRDAGEPTPNLTSDPATFALTVVAGETGAVRLIDGVLIVTPPPRREGQNVVSVGLQDGNVQVRVNGRIDAIQPPLAELDRLVIYGTKINDVVTVAPEVTLPATISGGQAGLNRLQAGNGPSNLKGWFGRTVARGGEADDFLVGRAGRLRPQPGGGDDLVFLGDPRFFRKRGFLETTLGVTLPRTKPPTGTFYRFVGNRLVPIPTPQSQPIRFSDRFVPAGHEPPSPFAPGRGGGQGNGPA